MEHKDQKQVQTQQVAREQEAIKETGQQVLAAAKDTKDLPTKEKIGEALKQGEYALQALAVSERGQELGQKQQQVLVDVQRVLEDEIKLLQENGNLLAQLDDPASDQLINDMKQLWNDVKGDTNELIDPELISGLKQLVIPMFMDHVQNIPIPAIHDSAEFMGFKYDYTVDNIHVSVPDLIPEDIHCRFECDIEANPLKLEAHNQRTFAILEVRDIQVHLHNVGWSYTQTSTPHLHDAGFVDIDTKGHGVGLKTKLEIKRGKHDQVLDVLSVECTIDKWDVKVTDSKHNFIYKVLTHMFGKKIRHHIQDTVEEKLKQFGALANDQCMAFLKDMRTKSEIASSSIKDSVKGAAEKALNRAQEIVRENADEDVPAITVSSVKEAKDELMSLVVEKATEMLNQQQEKIQARRANIQLAHQRTDTLAPPSTSRSTLSNSSFLRIARDSQLGTSTSIPPTPPPSPISASTDEYALSTSAAIPTAEEEYSFVDDTKVIDDQEPVPPTPATTPSNSTGWVQPPPPTLGFEVYPDLPTFSTASPARSTDSDNGSESGSGLNDESLNEKLECIAARLNNSNNLAPPRVNEQGTSQL